MPTKELMTGVTRYCQRPTGTLASTQERGSGDPVFVPLQPGPGVMAVGLPSA